MRRLLSCLPCLAFIVALFVFAAQLHASPGGPLSNVSSDALVALAGAALFALLAVIQRYQDRRVTLLEHELKNIASLVYNQPVQFQRDHPSRHELDDLRADIRDRFDRIESLLRERR